MNAEPSAAMAGHSIVYDEVGKINNRLPFFQKAVSFMTPLNLANSPFGQLLSFLSESTRTPIPRLKVINRAPS